VRRTGRSERVVIVYQDQPASGNCTNLTLKKMFVDFEDYFRPRRFKKPRHGTVRRGSIRVQAMGTGGTSGVFLLRKEIGLDVVFIPRASGKSGLKLLLKEPDSTISPFAASAWGSFPATLFLAVSQGTFHDWAKIALSTWPASRDVVKTQLRCSCRFATLHVTIPGRRGAST